GKRGPRHGAQHGRRGLLLHAAGQAGRLPAHRPGRRGQLHAAHDPLRLQRRHPAARLGPARQPGGTGAAARRPLTRSKLSLTSRPIPTKEFAMQKIRLIAGAALFAAAAAGQAQTVRIANQGDALSMDPHSLNESLQLSVTNNVYEPLVGRNKDLSLAPGLATSWKQVSPTVWRFELRKGVQFHDGTPFTADDVVFSLARVAGEGSDLKSNVSDIKEVRKVSDYVVDIETKAPFPILADQ